MLNIWGLITIGQYTTEKIDVAEILQSRPSLIYYCNKNSIDLTLNLLMRLKTCRFNLC